MTKRAAVAVLLALACGPLVAQEPIQDPLIQRLAGTWVLRGTIAGSQTTHDVEATWVLEHQYLQLHEVAREKDDKGRPAYEALVYIGWDKRTSSFACLWLDTTGGGGLVGEGIGHGTRAGDEIPFLFKAADGSLFHTTFAYDRGADAWRWIMDGEQDGRPQPFARVTLTRKEGP
jgi:hypothetical protein